MTGQSAMQHQAGFWSLLKLLQEKDPSMSLAAFQSLWCHKGILASVTSPSWDIEGRLELMLHLSATCPVLLC